MRFSLRTYEPQFRRCLFLIVLFSIPAWLTLKSSAVVDADVWWHLRTGEWIVQHRWVPYNDWFSNSGMGKQWAAYSWLFEVLIQALFSRLGLIGLLVYVYALMLAIAAALHSLVRKFESRLAYSVALTVLALLALAPYHTPRPWLFTILFFIIELDVLVSVRRSRSYRTLLILPLLFALWANLHIQFVYGLFVLGVSALEDPINQLLRNRTGVSGEPERPLPFRTMVLVMAACLVAILVNPYHFRIYAIVLDTLRLTGLYELISELQAMQFRAISDWLVLLLTLAAAFALGRRRNIDGCGRCGAVRQARRHRAVRRLRHGLDRRHRRGGHHSESALNHSNYHAEYALESAGDDCCWGCGYSPLDRQPNCEPVGGQFAKSCRADLPGACSANRRGAGLSRAALQSLRLGWISYLAFAPFACVDRWS